uniref:Early nodulin-93 n=2 Tax=Aegilops tauschii subsp. strangulata TaxID=200361 RepID=A0A453QN49_AEGTS
MSALIRNCRGCHGWSQGRGRRHRRCRSPHCKYTFLIRHGCLANIQQSCISVSLLLPWLSLQLASARMLPWARAHLNPTGQALIISTVAGMAYFIVADKTILSMARKHSYETAPEHLKNTSFH